MANVKRHQINTHTNVHIKYKFAAVVWILVWALLCLINTSPRKDGQLWLPEAHQCLQEPNVWKCQPKPELLSDVRQGLELCFSEVAKLWLANNTPLSSMKHVACIQVMIWKWLWSLAGQTWCTKLNLVGDSPCLATPGELLQSQA